jgi:cytochrome c biogenesis protein CcdA
MALRWLLVAALIPVAAWSGAPLAQAQVLHDPIELTIFYGEGCPYCAAELEFLDELQARIPQLQVSAYEVWNDEANRRLFIEMTAERGTEAQAVPTTILGEEVWVGFDGRIGAEIEAAVRATLDASSSPSPGPSSDTATVDVPLLGSVSVGDRSLVVATLVIGFVDGVNPCSLWVLSILLALVLHGRSRRGVVIVGATFLGVTSAMYGLYIVGFYSAIALADSIVWIQRGVAVVVGILGALQLAGALEVHGVPRLGISEERRPDLYRRMRSLPSSDRGTGALMVGTAGLAVGVSLMETPCTAGLPMLWTGMLADSGLAWIGMATLFGLYLLVFLLDELIVFGTAVVTMRAFKLQEHHGRALKLVSGVVMLSLAVVLLVHPEAMDSMRGSLVVFAGTAGLCVFTVGLDRALRGPSPAGRGAHA